MQTLDVVDGRKEKRKSGEIDIEKAIQNSRQELLSLEEQKKTRKFCFFFYWTIYFSKKLISL